MTGLKVRRRNSDAECMDDRCALPARSVGVACLLLLAAGCHGTEEDWPPAPRDGWERRLIASARRYVDEYDGWGDVAWVVERHAGQWRVQAWQIVNPSATGRMRCAPWAVRGIVFDNDANLVAYRNHL